MAPTNRLRRAVAARPFLATEVALLGVVVAGSLGLWGLVRVSAPVDLLWAAVLVTLLGAAQLPLVTVVHGLVDLRRLAAAEGWPSAASVLHGLWRTGELALAVTFLAFAASSTLIGESLVAAEATNVEGQGAVTMAFVFGLAFTALAEAALVLAVSARLVGTAVAARADDGSS